MTQTTLTQILDAIPTLELDELRSVQHAVEAQLTAAAKDDTEEGFMQALLETGLITEFKRPDRSRKQERHLVPIQGKPLSETIIEDRR